MINSRPRTTIAVIVDCKDSKTTNMTANSTKKITILRFSLQQLALPNKFVYKQIYLVVKMTKFQNFLIKKS